MGNMKDGAFGHFTGRIGNLVGYYRRGRHVTRMVPHPTTKPPTDKLLASRMQFKIAMQFVAPLKNFVSYSFHPETKGKSQIPQNAASSYIRNFAIQGEYPDYSIDYTKVVVSKGNLAPPAHPVVERNGNVLTFKWEIDPDCEYESALDQVMMLAYLPGSKNACFIVGGARRTVGKDVLQFYPTLDPAAGINKDSFVETYIAFISNDRQQVSDSIYIGRIVL